MKNTIKKLSLAKRRGITIIDMWSGGLILPIFLTLADVSLVAQLGHTLSLSEQLLGLVRISLLN